VMINRIKAALDARKDPGTMIMARINRLGKGVPEAEVQRMVDELNALGCDSFYVSGFTPDQQLALKNRVKKPLMVGSSGPASDWHSKGVDMAYYHIDTIGLGAMYMALKEIKATGKFVETAKMVLPSDVSARIIDTAAWNERAKRYGLV
jgi:2-methylisocitrate lyase-like PEP mutase family enzyme